MAEWFLKDHDFIHVKSSVAGKYNKHKQDGSHLGFPIWMILATVDLHVQVTSILTMNFKSIALSVQEKKFKIDFQDGHHGCNLGFPIAMIWAIFDLQVIPMLPTKFRVNWLLEEAKNRFSRWPILAIFDLQVTQMLPNKSGVSWYFSSEEDAKNRFSRWPPWQPSWISDRHDFSYFWSIVQVTPMLPTKFGVTWRFGSGEEAKNRFSRWRSSHLGFPIGMILAIFGLQITLMLPTKYRVNWPRGVWGVGF